jgi:hypothetical protein
MQIFDNSAASNWQLAITRKNHTLSVGIAPNLRQSGMTWDAVGYPGRGEACKARLSPRSHVIADIEKWDGLGCQDVTRLES